MSRITELEETVAQMKFLLQVWEPRVICPQCGNRYTQPACGPTHAIVENLVYG